MTDRLCLPNTRLGITAGQPHLAKLRKGTLPPFEGLVWCLAKGRHSALGLERAVRRVGKTSTFETDEFPLPLPSSRRATERLILYYNVLLLKGFDNDE